MTVRFDWYAATIADDPARVLEVLSAGLGAEVRDGTPRHGYEKGYDLRANGSTVARVLSGGKNGNPHAWASSDDTDAFVQVVRATWPVQHRVTRLDASEDFDGSGTWDRLYAALIELADERHLKVDQAGDWHRLEDGRTFYLGGRKSAVFCRLYEKGKQLRGLGGPGAEAISPDLVRLELEARPEGGSRYWAAGCEPVESFGLAAWSKELALRVLGLEVERVHIKERRESDDARALRYLVLQYGEHLDRLAAHLGGWANAGLHLRDMRMRDKRDRGDLVA